MKRYLFLIALMSGLSSLNANAQQPKWFVSPVLIDFSGPTPTATNLPGATTDPYYKSSNAAYDQAGNLLFYVSSGVLYQSNGTSVATLSCNNTEVSIIKVPGYCDRFYIIGTNTAPFSSINLYYTMVQVSGTSVAIVSGYNNINLGNAGGEFGGIAVSKLRPNNTRYLFEVGRSSTLGGVQRYLISSTGITYQANVRSLSQLYSENKPTEVELYENPANGTMKLAWNDFETENFINLMSLDNVGNFVSYDTIRIPGVGTYTQGISGLEFYSNGTKLMLSQTNANSSNSGVALLDIASRTTSFISGSSTYSNSQIEKAINGKYYAINNSHNQLGEIDPVAGTVTGVLTTTFPFPYFENVLPDQVDDEIYTAPLNWHADLFVSDGNGDVGLEPDFQSTNVWTSPDLWNCRTMMGNCPSNESPGYLNPGLGNNYVRVHITNRGCSLSQPAVLRDYWTMGSTGETWPNSWDSAHAQICSVVAGGQLTPAAGITIPALAPGQSTILNQPWDPIDPSVYACNSNLEKYSDGNPMICLLARIESAEDTMYSEQAGPISHNVVYNNNIVTRNTSLVPLAGSKHPIVGPGTGTLGSFLVQNYTRNNVSLSIGLTDASVGNDNTFDQQGGLLATLDADLWQAWIAGGQQGNGVQIYDPEQHKVQITNLTAASLDNLQMNPLQTGAVTLEFYLNAPTDAVSNYEFGMSQKLTNPDGTVEAGSECHFLVAVNGSDDGNERKVSSITGATQLAANLYPNPAGTITNLNFTLVADGLVSIAVTDVSGKVINVINENAAFSAGNHTVLIPTEYLSAGMYFIQLKTSDKMQTLKLNVLHN